MTKKSSTIGFVLIGLGLFFLLVRIFHIRITIFILPGIFIGLGLWILFGAELPQSSSWRLLGKMNRQGSWVVQPETLFVGIGDTILDFSEATIPKGETQIRVLGLIGDVNLKLPKSVAFRISASGLILDVEIGNQKEERILGTVESLSPGYETASKKIWIQTGFIFGDVRIRNT